MPKHSRIKPVYDLDSSEDEAYYQQLSVPNRSRKHKDLHQEDDELATISFGTLRDAQSKLQNEKVSRKNEIDSDGFLRNRIQILAQKKPTQTLIKREANMPQPKHQVRNQCPESETFRVYLQENCKLYILIYDLMPLMEKQT